MAMQRRVMLLLVALVTPAGAQEPLPEPTRFLAEVKTRLQTDEERQSGYAYVETRRQLKLDRSGHQLRESVKVFESYPGLPGERRWRRLISENGQAVPPHILEQRDRERQGRAEEYAREVEAQSDAKHASAPRGVDRRLLKRAALIEDAFRVFDMRMLGRETLDGHPVIAFALTPRSDARPKTREGKWMRNFTARAWVSEADHEVVRLEAEAVDDITIGLGLLARVHKGGRAEFHRRKVNGELWLPAKASYTGSARLLLFKMFRQSEITEYSNYRKFTVDTDAVYSRPK
jgi:hypothetical protein